MYKKLLLLSVMFVGCSPNGQEDIYAPGLISNFQAVVNNDKVTLTWENPTDADFAGVTIRRSTTAFPSSNNSGDEVYTGTAESATDTVLTFGNKFYYSAFAFDESSNFSVAVQLTTIVEIPTDLRLDAIESFNQSFGTSLGAIDYTVVKENLRDLTQGEEEFVAFNFVFSNLSYEQFEALRNMYAFAGTRSETIYAEGNTYSLADFLPPIIQATYNSFSPDIVETDPVGIQTIYQANCWNTAYEFLRNDHVVFILQQQNEYTAEQAIKYSSQVLQEKQDNFLRDDVQAFDIVLKYRVVIEHVAIAIDKNYAYEKMGSAASMPYRIISITELKKSLEIYANGKFSWYRPTQKITPPSNSAFPSRDYQRDTLNRVVPFYK